MVVKIEFCILDLVQQNYFRFFRSTRGEYLPLLCRKSTKIALKLHIFAHKKFKISPISKLTTAWLPKLVFTYPRQSRRIFSDFSETQNFSGFKGGTLADFFNFRSFGKFFRIELNIQKLMFPGTLRTLVTIVFL